MDESTSNQSVGNGHGLSRDDRSSSHDESKPLIGRPTFTLPVPRPDKSPQVSATVGGQRERLWTTVVFAIITSLPALLVGCTLGFPSIALLDLNELEERPSHQLSTLLSDLFGALAPIGAIFGGPIAGWIADHLGRKASLMLVGVPYLTGYLILVYARMISSSTAFKVVLMVGRFLTGVGLGWSCLAGPVYIAEISSSKRRGLFGSFTQLFLSAGLLVIYFLGSIPGFQYFNASLVLAGVVAVFEIGCLFICDTPRWLLAHGHKEQAVSALKCLRGSSYDIESELSAMELELSRNPHLKMSQVLTHFKQRDVFIPVLIMFAIMFFQQIDGLNASSAYSALIFKEGGVKHYRVAAACAVGGAGLIFTFLSLFIVDHFGRKSLLIVSGLGTLVGTVALGTHFYITRPSLCANSTLPSLLQSDPTLCNSQFAPLAIASLILFNISFSIGWGPVPWVLLGELIPQRVRGVGSGIATLVNWATAAIVTGFYLDYAEKVRTWFAWWSFSVMNFAAIVFVAVFLFETKGKTLEEIHHRYRRHENVHDDS